MLEWFAANLATIVVLLVIAALVVFASRKMIRDKRRGKGGCSCGGDCGACGACNACHAPQTVSSKK